LGDRYHMFFSHRRTTNYRGSVGSYRLGYAWSLDLVHWHRNDDTLSFEPSAEGWDSEMIAYPHVFSNGETWFMYYLGNGVGRDGFGLSRLTHKRGCD
jgi:hypothetical protein